jgi:hypothetical protein
VSDLALDPSTGDLLLENGRARLVSGAEFVEQNWSTRLTLFKGECFRDRSLGIDYQNEVLIKRPNPTVLRARFAQATRETPYIRTVKDLRFALDARARTLSVIAQVALEDGTETDLTTTEPVGG